MAKQRMMAGYKLQMSGVIAPGEPIKCTVNVPTKAEIRCMRIDPQGNFVLFCEVWSHPEGTKVNFTEQEILIIADGKPLPFGTWDYFETLSAGIQIFHVFLKGALKLEVAG